MNDHVGSTVFIGEDEEEEKEKGWGWRKLEEKEKEEKEQDGEASNTTGTQLCPIVFAMKEGNCLFNQWKMWSHKWIQEKKQMTWSNVTGV